MNEKTLMQRTVFTPAERAMMREQASDLRLRLDKFLAAIERGDEPSTLIMCWTFLGEPVQVVTDLMARKIAAAVEQMADEK